MYPVLNFSIPRLPFREDKLFGLLVLMFLSVPTLFFFNAYEKYETLKVALFLILSGSAYLMYLKQPETDRLRWPRLIRYLYWVLAILYGLSVVFSEDKITSVFGSYLRFTNGLVFFSAWLILLFLTNRVAARADQRRVLFQVLFFDAGLIAAVGILQSLGWGYYEGLDMPALTRAPSLLGNPNFSVMFLAACAGFAVPLLLAAKSLAARAYYFFNAILIVWAVVVLSSRGGWLGLGLNLLLSFCLYAGLRFPKKTLAVTGTLAVSAVLLWSAFYQLTPRQNLIANTLALADTNVNLRLEVWQLSAQAIAVRPWLGVGPGNFLLAYQQFRPPALANQGIFDDPHNLLVDFAVTSGLPFALCFLGLAGAALFFGFRQARAEHEMFLVASFAGLVSLLAMAAFNPVSSPNLLLLACFLAVLLPGGTLGRATFRSSFIRYFGGFFASALIAYGLLFFAGEALFYQGLKAFNAGNFKSSCRTFSFTLRLNPYQELAPNYLAACGVRMGAEPKQIHEEVGRISRLHPKRSAAYAMESNLEYYWYVYGGGPERLAAAIKTMRQAIQLDPYFARRYGRLGYYYLLSGQSDQAQENMKLELKMEPEYLPGWLLLAKSYQASGDKTEAVGALKKAFALRPDLKELKFLISQAESSGDIRKAVIPGGISPEILE